MMKQIITKTIINLGRGMGLLGGAGRAFRHSYYVVELSLPTIVEVTHG
jgi:hypothetical protein